MWGCGAKIDEAVVANQEVKLFKIMDEAVKLLEKTDEELKAAKERLGDNKAAVRE